MHPLSAKVTAAISMQSLPPMPCTGMRKKLPPLAKSKRTDPFCSIQKDWSLPPRHHTYEQSQLHPLNKPCRDAQTEREAELITYPYCPEVEQVDVPSAFAEEDDYDEPL